MSNKINQLQYFHIEKVAEMLRYYLCSSCPFVQRVCGHSFTI